MALVPDLSTQNTTFLILRSETSATGFVAGSVPHSDWAAANVAELAWHVVNKVELPN